MNGTVDAASKCMPPSRARYESTHPTISIRVSQELYDRADAMRLGDVSFADIFRRGLDLVERDAQCDVEVWEMGRKAGREEAERTWRLTFRCPRCGKDAAVPAGTQPAVTLARWMQERGWTHQACAERGDGRPGS